MPVIEAKHEGPCAVCGQSILVGERIDYATATGPRHLACADQPASRRRNQFRSRCDCCGAWVARMSGTLEVSETQMPDGTWSRRNIVRCGDVAACSARCGEQIIRGLPRRHR